MNFNKLISQFVITMMKSKLSGINNPANFYCFNIIIFSYAHYFIVSFNNHIEI